MSATAERHHLIRERTFPTRTLTIPLAELLDLLGLHSERACGKLTLNLSNGTCASIQFEERSAITSDLAQWQLP